AARGFGRIGNWPAARPFAEVISLVKAVFQVSAVRLWGAPPPAVQRLAVLGGSGGEFIPTARDRGAQIYITGEVRHHQVPPESLEDFAVLEVGHYSSEAVFMDPWAEQLRGFFAAAGLKVQIEVAQSSQAPLAFF
ncbi:MAG: Nif3-like dinuclear metal center hexameric protein, partial [Deltaproteobacteria bacterium]|nr:Nif3-like dinuclear metal center hexameric protein [Deltaproteobacteria bacterium]